MGWRIVTKEADGVEGRSSDIATESAALRFGCDMIRDGIEILRIEASDGSRIDADAIKARCAAR